MISSTHPHDGAGISQDRKKERVQREIAVHASGMGVAYLAGNRREDVQSRIFDLFRPGSAAPARFWALRNVDLSFYKGEIVGVIGSNGAGKTTFCRVVAGQLRPDEGSVDVHGRVTALLGMGVGFKKELSGLENIFLNAMMLGFSKREVHGRLEEIVSFSGLEAFIDQPLKYYSSGMKSRLAFSIAATAVPEILVMDEALSTGDIEFSEKAGEKLQSLISRSAMAFLVTHNLEFVSTYCDRALWIDNGEIRGIGRPEEMVADYRNSHAFLARQRKKPPSLQKTVPLVKERKVVSADNVWVSYKLASRKRRERVFWALRGIDLGVWEGEILGIIGANGAGKTTLCKALSGILKPETGNVRASGATTALLGFGAGFRNELTGRDNVYLNAMLLGLSRRAVDAVYDEIVSFSGLEKHMDKPVKHYSKGMRSRLGFSVVSQIRPDIFVIDEALSAGDILFYERASRKIQELMEEAKATIVVTHNIKFVERICTRTIWLHQGEIRFDGSPAEAVSRYKKHVHAQKRRAGAK
jgi:teichoic acid transport system ATP-binding protein